MDVGSAEDIHSVECLRRVHGIRKGIQLRYVHAWSGVPTATVMRLIPNINGGLRWWYIIPMRNLKRYILEIIPPVS